MRSKVQEKQRAIKLRKKGYSYNDILEEVDVARSTLSNWLGDLPLTDEEKQYLKTRKDKNISRGRIKSAAAHRRNREEKERKWVKEAEEEYKELKKDPFFLIGLALYWGEGNKRSFSCALANSDVHMTTTFISWVETFFAWDRKDLTYRLYIHKHYEHERCEEFWAKNIGIPAEEIRISFKPCGKGVKKRPDYKGCLRTRVPKSGKLLFKIKVWQNRLARESQESLTK